MTRLRSSGFRLSKATTSRNAAVIPSMATIVGFDSSGVGVRASYLAVADTHRCIVRKEEGVCTRVWASYSRKKKKAWPGRPNLLWIPISVRKTGVSVNMLIMGFRNPLVNSHYGEVSRWWNVPVPLET